MEESAKRRERLKAIRMEAAQTEVSNAAETSVMPGCLTNPLVETLATIPVQDDSCAPPRFDFYTDPMSAFSGNKKNKIANSISLDHVTPPRPRFPHVTSPYQYSTTSSPNQGIYQAPSPYHSSGPYRSPMRMVSPFPMQQGTPPGVWNESASITSNCFSPNSSRGGNISHPGFGQVVSPSFSPGHGRGQWFGNSPSPVSGRGASPSPNSGRGKGHWSGNSTSPNLGRGGRRWAGSHASASADDRPELFYNKSMVEDPWKFLKPVIWNDNFLEKNLNTPDSFKSWLPKSISMKKAKVSEATNQSGSQPSLAEYLAASFNEAINDASNV